MTRRVLFVLCGLALLAGLGLVVQGALDAGRAAASQDWPQIIGRIETAELVDRSAGTAEPPGGPPIYQARVTYRYEVNGVRYVGDRIAFGAYASSDPSVAHDILMRYSAGAVVDVYYDPDNPSSAVLEPGVGAGVRVMIGAGAAILIVGAVLGYAAARVGRPVDR